MVKKYDYEFKVLIVDLLNYCIKIKHVNEDYGLSFTMFRRRKREYTLNSGDFLKKNTAGSARTPST